MFATTNSGHLAVAFGFIFLGLGCDQSLQSSTNDSVERVATPLQIPGAQPRLLRPGAAFLGGSQYYSYVDADSHLRVVRSDSSGTFEQVIPESTNDGVQLVTFNDGLYLVWVGTDGQVNTLRSFNGTTWMDKRTFSAESVPRSADAPALVVYGNALNIFVNVKIERGDDRFWYMDQYFSFDGVSWPASQQVELGADHGGPSDPAVALLGNDLVLAWATRDHRLARQVYTPENGWSPIVTTDQNVRPSLVSAGDSVVLVGRSNADIGFAEIDFFRSTDGFSFQSLGHSTGQETDGTPTAISATGSSVDYLYIPRSGGLFRDTFFF